MYLFAAVFLTNTKAPPTKHRSPAPPPPFFSFSSDIFLTTGFDFFCFAWYNRAVSLFQGKKRQNFLVSLIYFVFRIPPLPPLPTARISLFLKPEDFTSERALHSTPHSSPHSRIQKTHEDSLFTPFVDIYLTPKTTAYLFF